MTDTTIKNIFKIIWINISIFVVLGILAELIFGNWLFGPKFGFLNIPLNTNYHFKVDDLYENNGRPINYRRDNLGFRGSYDSLSKIDIMTIGGSTTNQLYIDDKETWQSYIKNFFTASGRNITIINAGVDGQSTRGHIAIFDRWLTEIKGIKVRYILAYVGVNDMRVEDAQLGDQMMSDDMGKRIRHFILNNSSLYNFFRTIRGYFRARSAKLIHGVKTNKVDKWIEVQPFNTNVQLPKNYDDRLAAYKTRLRQLIKKIKEFGSEPIIVTQHVNVYRVRDNKVYFPENAPPSSEQWSYSIVRSFNNMSMEVCKIQKAICFDLARDVVFREEDFYDHVHNTPKGTRKIGQYLYTKLKPLFQ